MRQIILFSPAKIFHVNVHYVSQGYIAKETGIFKTLETLDFQWKFSLETLDFLKHLPLKPFKINGKC